MQIMAFCHGDPFDPHTWSGSNRGLFTALRAQGALAGAFDVEVRGLRRYVAGVREFSLNRAAWRQNFLKSPYLFAARSRNAAARLRAARPRPDAVLQTGALFDATAGHPELPRYCYLDSNTKLSERGGTTSFSHHASGEYKQMAFARERRIYHVSAGIFVFSDFVRDSLIRDFDANPARVHTVYAGVNVQLPQDPAATERPPVILFVGRDFERKGGPLLLEAFRRVRARVPGARLVIAGCRPPVSDPAVDVVGFIDKHTQEGEERLAALYASAAVFTMPSHFEPFGIPYAEAMHHGVACVAVNHCAMPEIVTHGVTGLLVPPNRPDDLAQALVTLLTDRARAREMGAAGRDKARRLFTWDTVAHRMLAVVARDREEACLRAAI